MPMEIGRFAFLIHPWGT